MTQLPAPKDDDHKEVSPELDAFLRADNIIQAINENLPDGVKQLPPIPANYRFKRGEKDSARVMLHACTELLGGLPALMVWAERNPDIWYPLYFKHAMGESDVPQGNTYVFNSPIPSSPLDNVSIDKQGRVIDVTALDVDDSEAE